MKRIAYLPGLYSELDGRTVCGDVNRDGNNEMIFGIHNSYINYYMQWQVWECYPINRYELVYVDTGWPVHGPYPIGIETGNISPFAVGLLDQDSMFDLAGMNREQFPPESIPSQRPVTTVQEGPSSSSYPVNLVWFNRLSGSFNVSSHYVTDLDQDDRKEIFVSWGGPRIYENTANNQYTLVYSLPSGSAGSWGGYAFSDFDQDGRMEIAYPADSSRVVIRKCTGDNQYPMVASLPFPIVGSNPLSNPHDCWDGRDVDNDGKPEFFIAFDDEPIFYLYMWEATGNNSYERIFIDQKTIYGGSRRVSRRSKCGDIDGDGIEEIVWATHRTLYVYKATGNNQFQQLWQWYQDHGDPGVIVNIYDMNRDGYKEIVVGGGGKTSIFEVEAVQVLRPNGGEIFQGDSSEVIRWQTFYPPRCDSLSLFYSTDNGRIYLPLASCISASDTSYLWTVPNVNSDSCKVKIIAYGPGWQYDESDGTFTISRTGINEIATLPLAMTLGVKIYPNPAKSLSVIRYSLPAEGKVSLQLYNISGRFIKTLVDEYKKPGNYKINLNTKSLSAGVYFLSLQTESKRIIERVVIVK